MEKYYTPELEEFCEGFVYELNLNNTLGWTVGGFTINSANASFIGGIYEGKESLLNLQKENLRVKYLDREDIESLGFEYSANYADLPELGFLKDTNYLSPYTQYLLYYNPNNKKLRIERIINCGTGLDDYLFNGIIKNKSELKKLLKQLCITK